MLIRRSLEANGNIYPAAFNVLAAIPEGFTYHAQHHKRHPSSAYGNSLRMLSDQWASVFVELGRLNDEYLASGKTDGIKPVLDAYSGLLFRLNEHLDACLSALRCLCEAVEPKPFEFDARVLDKAKLPGWKSFRDSIRPYQKDHIGLIVNTLKHRQGELCSIYFQSQYGFRPGYFVRDVLADGSLGPSSELHANGESAFSFARDMMVHLWWVYRLGELLAETVKTVMLTKHNLHLDVVPQAASDDHDRWTEVVSNCAGLQPNFFPDEVSKAFPRITFERKPAAIALEFPARLVLQPFGLGWTVSTSLRVDKEHRTNKMPYLARKA